MSSFGSQARNDLYAKATSSILMALFATSLIAIPLFLWSMERGLGVAMILFPILVGLAWAVGGWVPFLQTLGWFVVVLFWTTVKKMDFTRIGYDLNLGYDPLLEQELETKKRILEVDSEERFDELENVLRARHRFQTNRRRIFVLAAIVASIGTFLLYLDLVQLKSNGKVTVVPFGWKETKSENIYLAFPFIFVVIAVPLCVLFASYSKAYLAACVAGALYFGTAFLLIFRPSLPDMPSVVPHLVLGIVLTSVGLMVEWVTADSSHIAE